MKTKVLLLCILLACFHPLHAQLMSVYHRDSVPTYYEVSKIDSIRFINEQPYDVITTFRYTGSFSSPTSLVWGNTGMIPMEYGQSITYTSEGLNDYCCVFFNARMEPIYYGKRAPGLSDDNQYATVITESLVAPKETAYVCIYGKTNTSHPSYIPYELKVEINRLNNSGFLPDHVTEGSDGINPLSFAKILQMLIAGYTNTEMSNSMGISDLFDDSCQLEEIEGGEFDGEPCITLIDDDTIDGQIPSSLGKTTASGYGYFSLLLPFTLSLQDRWGVDVKAGLACEGHRVGLTPYLSSRDDYD